MKCKLLIIAFVLLISCKSNQTFQFKTSSLRLGKIINWAGRIIISDNADNLYEISGDTLKKFTLDGIVSISKCKDDFYVLKAPNDSTLIIEESNGANLTIRNRSGFKSKYFSVMTNEKCEIVLESGMLAFKIQENSLVDLNNIYGFEEIKGFNGSDKFGYFDNFVFLAQYEGDLFQSYLNTDTAKYSLPKNISVEDFTILNDELWLISSFYEINEEPKIFRIIGDKVEEVVIKNIPDKMDISLIYANGNNIYILSNNFGFFELKNNELKKLISIDLEASKVTPESFIVMGDLIFLSTFENGLIRFVVKGNDFDIKQIIRGE